MAEDNPIRKEDIIDIDGTTAGLKELIKLFNVILALMDQVKEQGKGMLVPLQNINPATKEGQVALAGMTDEANELKKVYTDLEKLQKKLEKTLTEDFKAETQLKQAIQDRTKAVKDEVRAEQAADGSLTQLRLRLAELKKAFSDAAPGSDRNKFLADLKKTDQQVQQLEKSMNVHSRGVGNYKNSIIAAGKELAGFLGIAGGGIAILGKLKDAFMDTEQGVGFMKRTTEGIKTFFQNIIKGNIQFAGVNALVASQIAKKGDEIRKGDRRDLVEIAKRENEIRLLKLESVKAGLSEKETLTLLTKIDQRENELIDYRIKDKKEELDYTNELLSTRLDDTNLLNLQAQLEAEIISLEGDKSLRNATKKAALEEKITAEKQKQLVAVMAAEKKELKDFQEASTLKVDLAQKASKDLIQMKQTEVQQTQAAVQADAEWRKQLETEVEDETVREHAKAAEGYLQIASDATEVFGNILERRKQKELSAAGDNAKAREAIERKYANKEKTIAIAQAVINGAQAITKTFAELGWPAGIVGAAVAAGITATQIGVIAAQKFAEGGEIDGKPHSQGGTVIEAEKGEYVIRKDSYSKYRDLVRAINDDNPMRIAEELRNRQFHTVWGGVQQTLSEVSRQDPFTKKMYELMVNNVVTYQDSNGDTVLVLPNKVKQVIRHK